MSADVAWQTTSTVAFSTAEVLSGVIIAAVSTMRPLVSRYVPGLRTKASTSGASYQLRKYGGPSRGASGLRSAGKSTYLSSASRRSNLVSHYPMQISGGGWLDLSDSGGEDNSAVRSPGPAILEDNENAVPRSGITVTKEWTVHA